MCIKITIGVEKYGTKKSHLFIIHVDDLVMLVLIAKHDRAKPGTPDN